MRANRFLGFSRDGIASLSWPQDPDDLTDFEITEWPAQFQELYRYLAVFVYAGAKLPILPFAFAYGVVQNEPPWPSSRISLR